jgi:internalin A
VERKQAGKPTIECGEKPYADVSVTELPEGIHYTTHDRLETKLDEIRAIVDASHALLVQNQQWTEQLLRETARMWNLLTKSLFSEAPSIFVIMPGDRPSYDPRGLFSEDFELYLLCQHPAGPHLVAGEKGYPAPKDREWWGRVRPWLRQLSKILKFVPRLSAVGKLYDEQGEKIIQLTLELSSAIADIPPEFAAPADRSARRELGLTLGTDVEAEGAALRALHIFLREAGKTQHWCGLQKMITNDGNILWLCAEHARFHGI